MTTTKVNLANTVEGILPVANGGTGSSTGVSPGGSTTQVQFNNAGAFGGSANLTFNGTTLTAAALTSTGVATFSAGTVSAPALTTTGDTNTGIFFPAADTIAFTEGGVESMRVDSSGNVQVGTATGSSRLTLAVPSAASTVRNALQLTDETQASVTFQLHTDLVRIATGGSDALAFDTNSAERMRITSAGLVGIGTSSPGQRLHVEGSLSLNTGVSPGSNGSGIAIYASDFPRLSFRNSTTGDTSSDGLQMYMVGNDVTYNLLETGYQAWNTSNAERMRIDSSGNVGIGTSSPSYRLTVSQATSNYVFAVTDGTSTFGVANQSGSSLIGTITNHPLRLGTNNNERFRVGESGQLGIGGANYGTSGQVLTSNGSGSAPSWGSVTLPAGTVLQVQQFETTATGTFGNSPAQLAGPFQVTITPSSASNKILIMCQINIGHGNGDCRYPGLFLRRNGSNINVGNKGGNNGTNVTVAATQQTLNVGSNSVCNITYLDSPGTTSAVTYSVWGQADFIGGDRTNYLNRPSNIGDAMRLWTASNIIAMEIKG